MLRTLEFGWFIFVGSGTAVAANPTLQRLEDTLLVGFVLQTRGFSRGLLAHRVERTLTEEEPLHPGGAAEGALAGRLHGFVGYGNADPSNVAFLVHGAEMRVAQTRAFHRALRKAYRIGICSLEEIGSVSEPSQSAPDSKKLPLQPSNGNGTRTVRDRISQVIRQHQLDPNMVKSSATDFRGVKALHNAHSGPSGKLRRASRGLGREGP